MASTLLLSTRAGCARSGRRGLDRISSSSSALGSSGSQLVAAPMRMSNSPHPLIAKTGPLSSFSTDTTTSTTNWTPAFARRKANNSSSAEDFPFMAGAALAAALAATTFYNALPTTHTQCSVETQPPSKILATSMAFANSSAFQTDTTTSKSSFSFEKPHSKTKARAARQAGEPYDVSPIDADWLRCFDLGIRLPSVARCMVIFLSTLKLVCFD